MCRDVCWSKLRVARAWRLQRSFINSSFVITETLAFWMIICSFGGNRTFAPVYRGAKISLFLLHTEWLASETMFPVCWEPGMGVRSAVGTGMLLRYPQVEFHQPSNKPKLSEPELWPCTTPSQFDRTASPSTDRFLSLERTTSLGSMLRRS